MKSTFAVSETKISQVKDLFWSENFKPFSKWTFDVAVCIVENLYLL
jgi:hypothetical protein